MRLTKAERKIVDALKAGKRLKQVPYSRLYGVYSGRRSRIGDSEIPDDTFYSRTVESLKAKGVVGVMADETRTRTCLGLLPLPASDDQKGGEA